jgi:asparagine synthase (glutamine-hydrolysing)
MCGLAGGMALRQGICPDQDRVRRMSAAVAHRGPDDDGFWVSPSGAACLAHRRLSIIDLATGHQPFLRPDSQAALIFNGEIYNYVEIRQKLIANGASFQTGSDTEVLLEMLLQRGEHAVDELIGMFTFAFWDERQRQLTLARDRVGKKPLYYVINNDCLYFCSTLRGLEQAFDAKPGIDLTSVSNFLNLGYIPAPDTIYRGVSKLPEASVLVVSQDRPLAEPRRYWDPVNPQAPDIRPEDALDHLNHLVEDAVRLRLRSDVPLGVFLSGGIDSSLVAAVASRLSENPISTFTIGFDVEEFNEAARARRIASHLGTEHHEFQVNADVLDLLPKLIGHFGEPFADSSSLLVWRIAEVARPHITVALMGDGGDEGFAGYNWYRNAHRLAALARLAAVAPLVRWTAQPFGIKARRLAYLLTTTPAQRFANLRCMFGKFATPAPLFDVRFDAALDKQRLAGARLRGYYRGDDLRAVHAMQYVDLRTYLPGDLLTKVDVCTMAHSLEARAPLLDHRILEFAFRLPPELHDVRQPKAMLRQILRRYVPPDLTDGPKRGFSAPLRDWFRGELKPTVEGLSKGPLIETGWFNPSVIANLVDDHVRGRRDNSERLFHLLVLEMWLAR